MPGRGLGAVQRTFLAAISRYATTISRLSESMHGLVPLMSSRARILASMTSSKRLETLSKQSSTVIRAMNNSVGLQTTEYKHNVLRVKLACAPGGLRFNRFSDEPRYERGVRASRLRFFRVTPPLTGAIVV